MTGGTFFSPGCPSDVGLNNQTVRNVIFLSAGGNKVRVRLSNAFGSNPLNVGAATVAISAGGAATIPGTTHTLRFNGKTSIVIAADSEVLSDPVDLSIPPLSIRTSHAFDGVIDFDKALRDPSDPTKLLPAFAGDPLHPNDAGYQAMANAVDLDAIIDNLDRDDNR